MSSYGTSQSKRGVHLAARELNNDFVLGKASKLASQKWAEISIFMPTFIIYSWVKELFLFGVIKDAYVNQPEEFESNIQRRIIKNHKILLL